MYSICTDDEPSLTVRCGKGRQKGEIYRTGPILSRVDLVSSSSGVEARSQTPPSFIRIAVERPPKGKIPNLANGLRKWVRYVHSFMGLPTERRSRHCVQPGDVKFQRDRKYLGNEDECTSRITVSDIVAV